MKTILWATLGLLALVFLSGCGSESQSMAEATPPSAKAPAHTQIETPPVPPVY